MSALAFNNQRVQELRRLLGRRSSRHDDGRFVVEGPVLVAEAVAAGWTVEAQFVRRGVRRGGRRSRPGVRARRRRARAGRARPRRRNHRSRSCEMPRTDVLGDLLATASFVVVLDRVTDPGNLGTILRSAEAAGADLVVLTPGSVDPYNPKVVRASAGALFHVPIVIDARSTTSPPPASSCSARRATTSPGARSTPYTQADLSGRIGIVMGNEAAGLPDEWNDTIGPIRRWVTIPHRGRSESLNVAMATTVLVFEAARQRTGQWSPSTSNDAG